MINTGRTYGTRHIHTESRRTYSVIGRQVLCTLPKKKKNNNNNVLVLRAKSSVMLLLCN